MTTVWDINIFYPLLFLLLIIVTVTIGFVLRGKTSDKKDTEIFVKSNDNAKEVTLKVTSDMEKMHNDVVNCLPVEYEKELHFIETTLKSLNERVTELENINRKLML